MSTRLDMVRTLHDGLGFAASRYSEVLRLSWFPLLLLIMIPYLGRLLYGSGHLGQDGQTLLLSAFNIAYLPVSLLAQASVMVALIGTAVSGQPPHHRSLHFSIGVREILYIITGFAAFVCLGVLVYGPWMFGTSLLNEIAREQASQEAFFFTEGSLHEGQQNLLYPDGPPAEGYLPWITGAAVVAALYVSFRLYFWPGFVAAGARQPFRKALRASAGFNIIKLIGIAVLMLGLQILVRFATNLLVGLGALMLGVYTMVLNILSNWGLGFATPEWADLLTWVTVFVVGLGVGIGLQAFAFGLLAGLTGSVIRQVEDQG